jgi:hypothetical protein
LIPEEHSTALTSRRTFLQSCAAILLAQPAAGHLVGVPSFVDGDPAEILSLDQDWLFGGRWIRAVAQPAFNDSPFARITLPHSVASLSWKNWHPDACAA